MAGPKHTNTDIRGDTTEQPNYMSLGHAQKDLVDRAVYGKIIRGNDFSAYEMNDAKNSGMSFLNPNANTNPRPRTDQVEQKIEQLREQYAGGLQSNNRAVQSEVNQLATHAPAGPEARRALNTIIKLSGDECGCSLAAPAISQTQLNAIIHPTKSGHGR